MNNNKVQASKSWYELFMYVPKGTDLNILKGVGHHGDEHVEQQDDGHAVVGDEQHLSHHLREVLPVVDLNAAGRHQREHGPEQRDVAREQPAAWVDTRSLRPVLVW